MSDGAIVLRAATAGDAAEISAVILETIRGSNAADYAPEVIERVSRNFSPAALARMIAARHVVVALERDRIVGTASLDGADLRSVFVLPGRQGRGIGARLVAAVLHSARQAGRASTRVQSTVTALGFYTRLGFVALKDHWHGTERTIIMERRL